MQDKEGEETQQDIMVVTSIVWGSVLIAGYFQGPPGSWHLYYRYSVHFMLRHIRDWACLGSSHQVLGSEKPAVSAIQPEAYYMVQGRQRSNSVNNN